jgi:broad specificity phosphatase PhoE
MTKENKLIKLFVVRHAESIANTEGIYQGQTYDTDLSELGKKQAIALAGALKKFAIKKIITSPLKRTYQTAVEVSKVTGVPVETNDLILETNHGMWEGKNREWIKENFKSVLETWQLKPGSAVFPNGESFSDTANRVKAFMNDSEHQNNTLVVTHDNILRILVSLANSESIDNIWKYNIESASLNIFETINKANGKNALRVVKLNDSRHLEGLRADLKNHAL